MTQTFKAACVQLNSGDDITQNLKAAEALICEAAAAGAQLISTPENTCHFQASMEEKYQKSPEADAHPGVAAFSSLAAELGVTLHIGSIAVRVPGEKLANRTYVFGPDGGVVKTYDKMHLCTINVEGNDPLCEKQWTAVGHSMEVAKLPLATLGLTICHDLRFPGIYQQLAEMGARVMMVPSAWAASTGPAHWEVLLRARAIENGSYVIAANQCGGHPGNRNTYGQSMIVSPWGEVLARAGDEPSVIIAELDMAKPAEMRKKIPSIEEHVDCC